MRLFRPRSSLGLAGRFLVLTIVVIGAVAATTAVAGLLQVQNLANDFGIHTAIKSKAIKVPAAGAPQTILLIGSDHRAGTSFKTANTDTMLLLRLNGSSSTINVLSLPRDLQVDIPGHGTDKLNAHGGSLAAGHPFGATGGRIVAGLAKALSETNGNRPGRGLISICAAGGLGVTAIMEAA